MHSGRSTLADSRITPIADPASEHLLGDEEAAPVVKPPPLPLHHEPAASHPAGGHPRRTWSERCGTPRARHPGPSIALTKPWCRARPHRLGSPDETHVAPEPRGGRVTLLYRSGAGLPAIEGTDVGLLLTEFRATLV